MKNELLLLMLVGISLPAHSRTSRHDEVSAPMNFTPYTTRPEEVRELLGEPSKKATAKDKMLWTYNIGTTHVEVYWDLRINRMEKYVLSESSYQEKALKPKQISKLETGTMAVVDVVCVLGAPKDMIIEPNQQKLHYVFVDNDVTLDFYDGKLMNYRVQRVARSRN
jgi:hypothetical protein